MAAQNTTLVRKFLVDPVFDAFYQGFYIHGIRQVAGPRHVAYTNDGFPSPDKHHCLNLIAQPSGLRIAIDTQDRPSVYPEVLDWCHVYGKVNIDPASDVAIDSRVVPIGPSFGIRLWNPVSAAYIAARLHLLSASRLSRVREHYANFWRQWRYRTPLDAYFPGKANPNFVFFLATLWADDPSCNETRAAFLRTVMAIPGLVVEGGFAPRARGDVQGFDALTVRHRYSLARYLRGVRQSAFVFNTPAVFGCLGWKLGEFLALGKAIVSLPLGRTLPTPMEHGAHAHFVDGSLDSIRDAVERLLRDERYRRKLEVGARQYFEEHLLPAKAITRLLNAAKA